MNFNKELENITLYEAGKPISLVIREFGLKPDEVIKLGSNENPYGSSPKVIEYIKNNASSVNFYPDDSMYELKNELGNKYNISANDIIIGSGSDQIIEFCIRAKCNQKSKVLMAGITFAMYEIYSKHVGAEVLKTPSESHKISEFRALYEKHHPDIIFLCLPNNPLGECLDKKEVFEFLSVVDPNTLVVIDGAYQEFVKIRDLDKSIEPKEILEKFSNVIYLGTFSKVYGLAGMRIGYGISHKRIIENLNKLRPPLNVNILSLQSAVIALKDGEFIEDCVNKNLQEMQRYENFAKENQIKFIPSMGNFITFLLDGLDEGTLMSEYLLKKGLIVRNLKSYNMNAIRITIGTKVQNDRVFQLVKEYFVNKTK